MRKMLDNQSINENAEKFRVQMERLLDFSDKQNENSAEIIRNGDWLLKLNYLEFMREIGVHFSVNKMLAAECFKSRLEKGLSFLEFNYMLLQSYDFLHLYRTKGVKLQLGGDDQWSNILAGADLIRRSEQGEAFAMTFTLLLTKDGRKMGKTEKGALWLDKTKCTPYEFYQYFRNVDDADVINCLKLLTFVPIEEIEQMERELQGAELNRAKELLAYEITKFVHGTDEAEVAAETAKNVFSSGNSNAMPTCTLSPSDLTDGKISITDLLVKTGQCTSKRDARTNVEQGGVTVDNVKITDVNELVTIETSVIVKKGKKSFYKVICG
jgi:tyrosyl-tRNA synthetase